MRSNVATAFVLTLCALACGDDATRSEASSVAGLGVHPCDELAAHPHDPERMAQGAGLDAIVPRPALQACEAAVSEHPKVPRFQYQYGRALLAAGRHEEAREPLERAAGMDYAGAWHALGRLHEQGLGVAVDLEAAAEHYLKAIVGGFPAEESLGGVVFNADGYENAAFLESLHAGKPISKKVIEAETPYLVEFLDAADGECGPRVSNRAEARLDGVLQMWAVKTMVGSFFGSMSEASPDADPIVEGKKWGDELAQGVAGTIDTAEGDFALFLGRHGCDSPVAKRFYGNLDRAILQ